MSRSTVTVVVAALCSVFLLGGCTTVRQDFPGVPSDQVWTAMVAVAQSPQYDEWTLIENEVWVDEDQQRIEVYRRTMRTLYQPVSKPQTQDRTWRFQVHLAPGSPPEAKFISRGMAVPAHAKDEGKRYFDDVLELLSGLPLETSAPTDG